MIAFQPGLQSSTGLAFPIDAQINAPIHALSAVRWSFVPAAPADGPLLAWIVAATDGDDEEDLGDEEDLAVSDPLADEESNFDDFDDEFDDDFEEEENDPDWDHPDDAEGEEPPPGKGPGRRK